MEDNEIIKSMQCVIGNEMNCSECTYQKVLPFPSCRMMCAKNALDLINRQKIESNKYRNRVQSQKGEITRLHKKVAELTAEMEEQKAEIERLKKNYEELIYKTECLLCHATGNKFSKYTYTTQEMISFVDDYIQDCCDEVIEETKATAKSEAIKEFTKKVDELLKRYSAIHNNAKIAMQDEIECDNETIEMQSVWDVHTLIANEMGSEPEEMNRLQDNIETIAKERLLKEIEKDFRLLVKEMTEVETNQRKEDGEEWINKPHCIGQEYITIKP